MTAGDAPTRATHADLAEKVAFLQRPEAYAAAPSKIETVETIETHMAWVFLTNTRAYKLQKPVRDGFRDFSTPAARRRSCKNEVRLNSRLAPGVYLAVIPLVRQEPDGLRLGGAGEVVDWLVEMRRLPQAAMLDYQIRHGTLEERSVRALGRAFARFYQRARRVEMTALQYRRRLVRDIFGTRSALLRPHYHLCGAQIIRIAGQLMNFLHTRTVLFDERVHNQRIVDGHGDLRLEHICLEPEPLIIDCIEYNTELRVLDAASDMAFLQLECERVGVAYIGRQIMEIYARHAGDSLPPALIHFYAAQHAFTRAKIAIWHLDDPQVADPSSFAAKANHYLALAEMHAVDAQRGLPGERTSRRP